jgi:hypothetical protein
VTGLRLAATRIGSLVLFAFLPALVLCPLVAPWSMIDFGTFWYAGGRVLDGATPYPPVDADVLVTGLNFVYPPQVALAVAPLALLPYTVAAAAWAVALVGATVLSLRLVGVRDPRLYGLVFLFPWTLNGVWVGAITPLLVLGVAAAWRWRDRPYVLGLLVAAVAVAKVFLWPLLVWLVATRRTRAASVAAVAGAVSTVLAWSALAFAGLVDYPSILRVLAEVEQHTTYSVTALALALGASAAAAQAATVAAGLLALAGCVALGRRDDDAGSLAAALAAALLLTPIVWPHYLALLVVPLAIARPRLDAAWLLPLSLWLVTGTSDGVAWKIALAVALVPAVVWAARRQPPAEAAPAAPLPAPAS